MMTVDPAASLPAEVLFAILDHLVVAELARLVILSRRWATIVKSHPAYWSQPQLADSSPSAVAFFNARVAAGAGNPFEVRIIIPERFALLDSMVLPNLASHLDRVVHLMLNVHISHAPAVFALLNGASLPLLRYLQLFFEIDKDPDSGVPTVTVVTLPTEILSGDAHPHGVQTVLLKNIDIAHSLPPALSSAVNLVYYQNSTQSTTSLRMLADAFPCARDVSLVMRTLRGDVRPSAWPPRWETLDSLMLPAGKRRSRKAIRTLPLARIRHLTLTDAGQEEVDHLLTHVPGPLHLSFKELNKYEFMFHVASLPDGRVRSFRENRLAWVMRGILPHNLLQSAAVLDQVAMLTIPLSLWNLLVKFLPPSNRLEKLVLAVVTEDDLRVPLVESNGDAAVLICPNLRTLLLAAVRSSVVVTVTFDDASRTICDLLRAPAPIALELQNFWAPGWTEWTERGSVFNSVRLRERSNLYPATPWHS